MTNSRVLRRAGRGQPRFPFVRPVFATISIMPDPRRGSNPGRPAALITPSWARRDFHPTGASTGFKAKSKNPGWAAGRRLRNRADNRDRETTSCSLRWRTAPTKPLFS